MSIDISKSEFKARAMELFRQIETTGQSLVVTDHGRPVLEVRPYRAPNANPLDLLRGSVTHYEGPTKPVASEGWDASAMWRYRAGEHQDRISRA
jgi:antitoxin (DNA-binding transcriptional repressor) of toxin-antitoxin stability system